MPRAKVGCDCRCDEEAVPCSGLKSICAWPATGVLRRCLNGNWTSGNPWYNETPHKVTTFTGVAGFDAGRVCACDIAGRIWRKRDHPTWHVYDIVHTAGVQLNDITFVVRQQGENEQQEVIISGGPTGGSFTLTFDDTGSNPQTTAPIAWPYTVDAIEDAVEALSNLDDVEITAVGAGDFIVEFRGIHARENVRKMTVDTSSLTGPAPISGNVLTVVNGLEHRTTGIAIGAGGTVLRSIDHGATWAAVTSGTAEDLNRVAGSGKYWFIAGDNGTLLRSADHGATWTTIATGTTEDVLDIAVAGSKLWLAASAEVLRSTDRGLTWSPVAGITGTATAVATAADETTWLFTSNGGTAGKIWKTTDQGVNWAEHNLSGTLGNVTRAAVYLTHELSPAAVYAVTSGTVTSPTLSELRWTSGQDSIAYFGRDLYACGANTGLPSSQLKSPCLAGSPTQWTIFRLEDGDFSYCPIAAFATNVNLMVQIGTNPGCVWTSLENEAACDFVAGPPLETDYALWTLDLSGADAVLTFTTANTGKMAVYRLPIADWNVNAANLMVFDEASSTDGPTGHDELWLCPGTYEPCTLCEWGSWQVFEVVIPSIPGVTPGFTTGPMTFDRNTGSACVYLGSGVQFAVILNSGFDECCDLLFKVDYAGYQFLSYDPNTCLPAGHSCSCDAGVLPVFYSPFGMPDPDAGSSYTRL